jgi:hypothetical protein
MTKKKVLIPTKLDKVARELLEKNGNYVVVQEERTELLALAKQHPDAYAGRDWGQPLTIASAVFARATCSARLSSRSSRSRSRFSCLQTDDPTPIPKKTPMSR